jgi:iron complex transport system permease protein
MVFKLAQTPLIFAIILLILLLTFLLSISVGAVQLGLLEVWALVFKPNDSISSLIVQTLRLPRAIIAILVGSSLAVSATLLQGVTRNPLAGPGILGVNAGAALMLVIATVFIPGLPSGFFVLLAFVGGLGAAVLTFTLTSLVGLTPVRLSLAGISVAALLSALTSAIQIIFETQARAAIFSLAGSLAGRTWEHLWMIAPWVLVAFVPVFFSSSYLNLIALDTDISKGLGVKVDLVRFALTGLAVLLASAATSVAGPIGFLGLMSPHLARGLVGVDNRLVLPMAALIGSSILLLADMAARIVDAPLETPVGILITAIGAPFLVYLVRRMR